MVRRTLIVAGGLLALVVGAASGGFLVVDEPRKSDVIMVLAGETDRRPARALELFDQGYASKIVLDKDAARCLNAMGGRNVIVVTSDFHTRRALSVFTREIPDYKFSVAAAYNPSEFGVQWWRHRQWAKVNFDEWLRLLWWEAIDRWR